MKLAQRGYPPGEIAAALDRLTEQKYLDDRVTARVTAAFRKELGTPPSEIKKLKTARMAEMMRALDR